MPVHAAALEQDDQHDGLSEAQQANIALAERYAAHNYHPLPVVIAEGRGSWVTDMDGKRYLDCLAAYSALNFGHLHPALVAAAESQLHRLTLTSRAFHAEPFAPFAQALCTLAGKDMMLPMNTGAEAVETGIKVARAWGYRVRGVPADRARIVVMDGNFHGRTTTLISMSNDPSARTDFSPFTPGFVHVPFGDATALEQCLDDNTVAVLVEPIQGEAGVKIPPSNFLPAVRDITRRHGVLFIADEIQSGLGRTGATFCCDNAGLVPDLYLLGKALGGGILPLSAVVGDMEVLGVLRPGEHGSTFGGNPLAAAIGHAVVDLLATGELQQRSGKLGAQLRAGLDAHLGHGVQEVRHMGLWAGVDIAPEVGTGRQVAMALLKRGVLAKETHGNTIRLAPPLVIEPAEIDWLVDQFGRALHDLAR